MFARTKLLFAFALTSFIFTGNLFSAEIITAIERYNSTQAEPMIAETPLGESVPAYVDRTFEYSNIPLALLGADYVLVAMNDKMTVDYELDVSISQDAVLYLFFDNRLGHGSLSQSDNPCLDPNVSAARMDWVLNQGFTDTGLNVGVDTDGHAGVDIWLSVYSKDVAAGVYTLHQQNDGVYASLRTMYGIAAAPIVTMGGRSGIAAYYPLDYDPYDYSGNGLSGVEFGSVSYNTGKSEEALELFLDGYIDCGNESLFEMNDQITVTGWIKVYGFSSTSHAIVAKGDSWGLYGNLDTDALSFDLACVGECVGSISVNDGRWHHVAGTYDGKTISLYVDGVLDNSVAAVGVINITSDPVQIGANSSVPDSEWYGQIDEVQIHCYALSANRLKTMYYHLRRDMYLSNPDNGMIEHRDNQGELLDVIVTGGMPTLMSFHSSYEGAETIFYVDEADHFIKRINLSNLEIVEVVNLGTSVPSGMALGENEGKIYWIDPQGGTLSCTNMDGTEQVVLLHNLANPSDLVVDEFHNDIYVSEVSNIVRCDSHGDNFEYVISGTSITDFALYSGEGKLYWCEGAMGEIRRANLDGSDIDTIVSGIGEPDNLVVSPLEEGIYWIDLAGGSLHSSDYEGNNPRDLSQLNLNDRQDINIPKLDIKKIPIDFSMNTLSEGFISRRQQPKTGDCNVYFVTDTNTDNYRASPQVVSKIISQSDGKDETIQVLVNRYKPAEDGSSGSRNIPMVIYFETPVQGVGLELGCVSHCGHVGQATVSLYDCKGQLLGQEQKTPTWNFKNSTVQLLAPSGKGGQLLVIDYGDTDIEEAIDNLHFILLSKDQCKNIECRTAAPTIQFGNLNNKQTNNYNPYVMWGTTYVVSGGLQEVRVNGKVVDAVYPFIDFADGNKLKYRFSCSIDLPPNVLKNIKVEVKDPHNNYGWNMVTEVKYVPPPPPEIAMLKVWLNELYIVEDKARDKWTNWFGLADKTADLEWTSVVGFEGTSRTQTRHSDQGAQREIDDKSSILFYGAEGLLFEEAIQCPMPDLEVTLSFYNEFSNTFAKKLSEWTSKLTEKYGEKAIEKGGIWGVAGVAALEVTSFVAGFFSDPELKDLGVFVDYELEPYQSRCLIDPWIKEKDSHAQQQKLFIRDGSKYNGWVRLAWKSIVSQAAKIPAESGDGSSAGAMNLNEMSQGIGVTLSECMLVQNNSAELLLETVIQNGDLFEVLPAGDQRSWRLGFDVDLNRLVGGQIGPFSGMEWRLDVTQTSDGAAHSLEVELYHWDGDTWLSVNPEFTEVHVLQDRIRVRLVREVIGFPDTVSMVVAYYENSSLENYLPQDIYEIRSIEWWFDNISPSIDRVQLHLNDWEPEVMHLEFSEPVMITTNDIQFDPEVLFDLAPTGNRSYDIVPSEPWPAGAYTVTIMPTVTDYVGNALDPCDDGRVANAYVHSFVIADVHFRPTNAVGELQTTFEIDESIYICGENFAPGSTFRAYLVAQPTDSEFLTDLTSSGANLITVDPTGAFGPIDLSNGEFLGKFNLVADINDNQVYNPGVDRVWRLESHGVSVHLTGDFNWDGEVALSDFAELQSIWINNDSSIGHLLDLSHNWLQNWIEKQPALVKINFQPEDAMPPPGYLPDSGQPWGDRGNGSWYGWNMATFETRDRGALTDQRYDTLNHMQSPANPHAIWEIALENGAYDVNVVCGDASFVNAINNIDVEGTALVDPDPWQGGSLNGPDFDECQVTVSVNDGRLTVQPAYDAHNAKICFLKITPAQ